jgi:hypothetical protein
MFFFDENFPIKGQINALFFGNIDEQFICRLDQKVKGKGILAHCKHSHGGMNQTPNCFRSI